MRVISGTRGVSFSQRPFIVGAGTAIASALLMGIPTDVVPNSYFTRMTPVRPQDYVFLSITALLIGLVAASYTIPLPRSGAPAGKVTAAGLLSYLAVGCPACNKVVLLLLGTSGALTYWAPLQPLIALASILLLTTTLWFRIRALRSPCPACGETSRGA